MARLPDNKYLLPAGLAGALLLLAAIAIVSVRHIDSLIDGGRQVSHTHAVIGEIEEALADLQEAESGQRGYLLTGDERFLEPYNAAVAHLPEQLRELREITADNAQQQAAVRKIEALATQRLASLKDGIERRRQQPAALAPVELDRLQSGRAIMDQIRSETAGMREREESLLRARDSVLSTKSRLASPLILIGNAAAVAVIVAVFTLLQRESARRRAAQISAQKHVEEVEDLYNNAPCGYHSLDKDGVIVKMNDTELLWLGYTRSEVVGKKRLSDLLTPESLAKFDQQFVELKRTGIVNDVDLDLVRSDGTILPVIRSASAQRDENGEFMMSRSTVFDSTERRRRDAETRKLNETLRRRTEELEAANKELEAFGYSVSHDLRIPLRAMDGYSHMLEEDYSERLDAEGKRMLRAIRHSATKLSILIDDLLTLSRLAGARPNLVEVDMNSLVDEVLAEVKAGANPAARVTVEPLAPAKADRTLLRQVWANLLTNAFKYSSGRPQPVIAISSQVDVECVAYTVRDNGVGFNMKYYDKLFGVFQRLHGEKEFPGTGVGLAIVRRVVSRLGGRVWAEGSPDEGASFHFTLPRGVEG
ncbi:MAG TPA: CHASE3 domain-containing protein [Casimicrobiaceae bacterium]|nr:CHASE3 domain-containing protein [Casimicrobiaceae bacterium]